MKYIYLAQIWSKGGFSHEQYYSDPKYALEYIKKKYKEEVKKHIGMYRVHNPNIHYQSLKLNWEYSTVMQVYPWEIRAHYQILKIRIMK